MLGDAVGVSPGIAPPSTCYNPGRQLPKPLASASMPKRGTDDAWKPSEADDRELRCSARLQQRSKVERSGRERGAEAEYGIRIGVWGGTEVR